MKNKLLVDELEQPKVWKGRMRECFYPVVSASLVTSPTHHSNVFVCPIHLLFCRVVLLIFVV